MEMIFATIWTISTIATGIFFGWHLCLLKFKENHLKNETNSIIHFNYVDISKKKNGHLGILSDPY